MCQNITPLFQIQSDEIHRKIPRENSIIENFQYAQKCQIAFGTKKVTNIEGQTPKSKTQKKRYADVQIHSTQGINKHTQGGMPHGYEVTKAG